MAKKYKLSDEEKEKARKVYEKMNEDQQKRLNSSSKSSNKSNNTSVGVRRINNNNNSSSYRQTSNSILRLPTARVTNDNIDNMTLVTSRDLKAMREAEKTNKEIEKGGYRAINARISNTLKSFQGGVQQGIAGIGNAITIPIATALKKNSNMAKKLGFISKDNENGLDRASDILLDVSDNISSKGSYASSVNSRINNDLTRTLGNVSNVVGNMLPSIASNVVAPGSGLLVTGVSAGGNSAQETINNDRSNLNRAILTGAVKGGVEALTEKLTGGNILSKGSLDDFVGKTISSKVKSSIGKNIANKVYQFAGEMLEEQISDNAGYLIDKVINNKDLPDF